jgi:diguanylate cyclase (GGDEF)-like protein
LAGAKALKSNTMIDALETNSDEPSELLASVERLKLMAEAGACTTAVTPVIENMVAQAAAMEERLAWQNARIHYLESLSVTDEVTDLFNRRGFDQAFQRTLARARRNGEQGLLVLCDLDRFKAINDTYGHPAGDVVLHATGEILRGAVRDSDIVARLGGDEFAVVMVDADPTTAPERLNPLHHRLARTFMVHEDVYIPVSCSIGYAAYGPNSDVRTVITLADKALYRAKHPVPAE